MNLKELENVVKNHDLVVVACSFGRDSMVVLDMASKVCSKLDKPFKVIWNDTGVEYPEQYKFNKEAIKQKLLIFFSVTLSLSSDNEISFVWSNTSCFVFPQYILSPTRAKYLIFPLLSLIA